MERIFGMEKKLAEHRIIGVKYVGINIDVDNDTMTFLTFFESKEQFNQFRRYLRRNEISSFTNSYSMNRWSFQYNFETQSQNVEYGTSLSYLNSGRSYSINELEVDVLRDFLVGEEEQVMQKKIMNLKIALVK